MHGIPIEDLEQNQGSSEDVNFEIHNLSKLEETFFLLLVKVEDGFFSKVLLAPKL